MFIGRDKELNTIDKLYKSDKFGFVVKRYLLVGINYEKDDKNKTYTCVIEELEKR